MGFIHTIYLMPTTPMFRNVILLCCLLTSLASQAQQAQVYWLWFTAKAPQAFDAGQFFHPKAIERRLALGLDPADPSEWPICPQRQQLVSDNCTELLGTSRWLNAAELLATPQQLEQLKELPFVQSIELAAPLQLQACVFDDSLSCSDLASVRYQTERMQGHLFNQAGFDGTGVMVAILDAGFPGVDESPYFEHIRKRGGIKATKDFTRRGRENAYRGNEHGTMVLSCIAGIDPLSGQKMGVATGADFLLAITEMNYSEGTAEQIHWIKAIEWADQQGADIANSSLGYTLQSFYPEDMTGKFAKISRAATAASERGLLIVSAAGNEYDKSGWKIIAAPGDAPGVLTVGATNPYTDLHASYSSVGPTADGRLKPEVCNVGTALLVGKNGIGTASGTSFASPLTAGFAACLKQMHPEWTSKMLYESICESAHLHPYYDYAHGYGIPQAGHFLGVKPDSIDFPLPKLSVTLDSIIVVFDSASIVHSVRKDGDKTITEPNNCYLQLLDEQGRVLRYWAIRPSEPELRVYHGFPNEVENQRCAVRLFFEGLIIEE